jgi:hypothetical protein
VGSDFSLGEMFPPLRVSQKLQFWKQQVQDLLLTPPRR